MEKRYLRRDWLGLTIDEVVKELQRLNTNGTGLLFVTDFNGVDLYSDTVTLDGAYKAITGYTKEDFEKHLEEERLQRIKEKEKYLESIPALTKEYKEKAKGIISDDKLEKWGEVVHARLNGMYRGMELGCCLEIITVLNENDFETAKQTIEKQNHSGASEILIHTLLKEFADNGKEFLKYIDK